MLNKNYVCQGEARPYLPAALRNHIAAALLGVLSFLIMIVVSVPIIPMAAYLKYEPSGMVILLAATVIHPTAGLLACFIKDMLSFFVLGAHVFGVLGDFLCTGSFALVAALLLPRKGAGVRCIPALLAATCLSTLVMIPVNFLILYLEFGMLPQATWAAMPGIIAFNLCKGVLNSGIYISLASSLLTALRWHR